jgi:hypothetical protein
MLKPLGHDRNVYGTASRLQSILDIDVVRPIQRRDDLLDASVERKDI